MRDSDFGAKIELLEYAVGWRFGARAFQNRSLGDLLGVPDSSISHKKSGQHQVSNVECSILTERFLSHAKVDPMIWRRPLDTFRRVMLEEVFPATVRDGNPRDAGYRIYKLALRTLNREIIGFRILRHLRGGLAGDTVLAPLPVFYAGEVVRVAIRVPDEGVLFVIDEMWEGERRLVMPSRFAPGIGVKAGQVELPTSPDSEGFAIGAPFTRYRTYAIWFRRAPDLSLCRFAGEDADPALLDPSDMNELATVAESRIEAGGALVASRDYLVKDPARVA